MLILRPRASRIAPREAEAMPLPRDDTTPPVTKTNRVMGHRQKIIATRAHREARAWSAKGIIKFDGSSDYQNGPLATIAEPTIVAVAIASLMSTAAHPPTRSRDPCCQGRRSSVRPARDRRLRSASPRHRPWEA